MNSEFSLKETDEMPVQIFESDVETQENNEANQPTQVQENLELGVPPTAAPPSQDLPREKMKYYSCGKCGNGFNTADEVEIHLGTNHGIPGNYRYGRVTSAGVTPITGPEEPPDADANADPDRNPKAPTNQGLGTKAPRN